MPRAKSATPPSTPRLSEAARHVVIPKGIVTTSWPRVEAKLLEIGGGTIEAHQKNLAKDLSRFVNARPSK